MKPTDDPPLGSNAMQMIGLLWKANHEMETLSKWMMRVLGVTGPQRMVLRIIDEHPDISAKDISKIAQIHPSTLTGILDRLCRADMIKRSRDQDDGRKARFIITTAGQRITQQRQGTVESAMRNSMNMMEESEQKVVRAWLESFGFLLEKECIYLQHEANEVENGDQEALKDRIDG